MTKRKKLLISIVAIILIAAFVSLLLFLNRPLSSQQNLDLMTEAFKKKDPKICNQIRGGIEERKGKATISKWPNGNVIVGDDPGRAAMTEAQAKEQCYRSASAI